jgi:transcriptional regulator with XRE-family HTH domain
MKAKQRRADDDGGGGHAKDFSDGLGNKLRQARERKGMTVRGLARYVGVSPSLISQVERGRVMPSVARSIRWRTNWGSWSTIRSRQTNRKERDRAESTRLASIGQRHNSRKVIRLAGGVR